MKTSAAAEDIDNNFAHDLESEVQLRLPPKSLSRFESVSKSWGNQILDPCFRDKYHMRSKKNPKIIFYKHKFHHFGEDQLVAEWTCFNSKTLSLCNILTTKGTRVCPVNMMVTPQGMMCYIGTKNNTTESQIFLYSLSTKVLLELPMGSSSGFSNAPIASFGIGYLPSIQKFKLALLFINVTPSNLPYPHFKCQIIEINNNTLGDGTMNYSNWRLVDEHIADLVDSSHPTVLVDSTLNWKSCCNAVIISFDLKSEKFRRVNYPSGINHVSLHSTNKLYLVNLQEKLGLLILDTITQHASLWKLQDHGSHTWEKRYNFSLIGEAFCIDHFWPIYVQDGEMVIHSGSSLIFYHFKKKALKILDINVNVNHSYVGMYYETLCSG
ncbi:hypothetical protein Lal_00017562 [Lupinus albus]|uniref:Putative F-box domain, kelch-type beta propeller, F-box associated interaction n=1 Tax=Lupinus albus TaxID=3870 RepID=A0A6A5MD35_LUPAL|nr:putative F-box domain, kelch-type beta propeller, F-box associated interaction [Lupinus albus]KAF1869983.1 hypothetical protein Lal_00017562 [Lupinus albus]